jgi:glycosyltransferase involved in cell wall biosynthesis
LYHLDNAIVKKMCTIKMGMRLAEDMTDLIPPFAQEPEYRIVIWALGRHGTINQLPLASSLFKTLGSRLSVIASEENARLEDYAISDFELMKLPVLRRATNPLKLLSSYFRGLNKLKSLVKSAPTIIHIVGSSPFDVLYLPFLKRHNVTVLFTIHDAEFHLGEESVLLGMLQKIIFSRAQAFATLTHFVKNRFIAISDTRKPVYVVPNSIVNHLTELQRPRKFPSGRVIKLLFIGRVVYYKGIDLLLEAAGKLRERSVKFELTIAGRGDLQHQRSKIESLNIKLENDWISDQRFAELLSDHDVVILPYREASQSGVVYNAFNAALPIVCTPVGGLQECVENVVNGLVTGAVTGDAIADAIEKIVSNKNLYERLSVGAHETGKTLTADATAEKWLTCYDRIIADVNRQP